MLIGKFMLLISKEKSYPFFSLKEILYIFKESPEASLTVS